MKINNEIKLEVTSSQLAATLGISTRRVRQLASDQILEKSTNAKFQLQKNVQRYLSYKIQSVEDNHASVDDELRKARSEELNLRIAKTKREVIMLDEALDRFDELLGFFLTFLVVLPAKITSDKRERDRVEAIINDGRKRLIVDITKSWNHLKTGDKISKTDFK